MTLARYFRRRGLTPNAAYFESRSQRSLLIAPRSGHFDRGAINDYGQAAETMLDRRQRCTHGSVRRAEALFDENLVGISAVLVDEAPQVRNKEWLTTGPRSRHLPVRRIALPGR